MKQRRFRQSNELVQSRHDMEERGVALAESLSIDLDAYRVASNLHWSFTLMRTHLERGPLLEDNLSMSAFVALWSMRVSGEMEGRELADEVGIARSSLSGLASRLERRGLIQRIEHPTDGRSVLFDLTTEGTQMIERVWPKVNAAERLLTDGLSSSDQADLAGALRRMADRLTVQNEVDTPGRS